MTVRARYNAAQGLVDDGADGFVVKLDADEIRICIEKIIKVNLDYEEMVERVFYKSKKYDWDEIVVNILYTYSKRFY